VLGSISVVGGGGVGCNLACVLFMGGRAAGKCIKGKKYHKVSKKLIVCGSW